MNIRARHARMQHVAHDGNRQIGKVFLVVADGVHVEQTLGRVRMPPVACVDHVHMGRYVLGNQIGRARFAMAHHKNVSRHGAQVGNGVKQRLAFGRAGPRNIQVDHVRRQARGGNVKGGAGARAVLKKQVEHAFAPQKRHLLHLAVAHRHKLRCGVQNVREHVFGQALGGQQVDQFAVFVELGIASA